MIVELFEVFGVLYGELELRKFDRTIKVGFVWCGSVKELSDAGGDN